MLILSRKKGILTTGSEVTNGLTEEVSIRDVYRYILKIKKIGNDLKMSENEIYKFPKQKN
jgi:hypothetical protein